MKRPSKTPPFLGSDGKVLHDSIADARYLRIGGLDQYVLVRGESVDNPVLIVLHGGPGFSDTSFLRWFTPALEKIFTVVYWDQRGTGKSFDADIPRSSMTVAQFVSDLDELVEAMRIRLRKNKVAILGHSWGSALGVLYTARFPQKVSAYVGVAQIGDCAAAEALSYDRVLAEGERRGDERVVRKLREIGPPPYDVKSVFIERTCAQRINGDLNAAMLWKMLRMIFGVPESSVLEVPATMRAFRFTMDAMWPEVSRLDLTKQVPALDVPVFFMLGRRDPWIPPETSVAYFEALQAPAKKLVWFDASSHEPFVDEPEKFVQVMQDVIRPACMPARSDRERSSAGYAVGV